MSNLNSLSLSTTSDVFLQLLLDLANTVNTISGVFVHPTTFERARRFLIAALLASPSEQKEKTTNATFAVFASFQLAATITSDGSSLPFMTHLRRAAVQSLERFRERFPNIFSDNVVAAVVGGDDGVFEASVYHWEQQLVALTRLDGYDMSVFDALDILVVLSSFVEPENKEKVACAAATAIKDTLWVKRQWHSMAALDEMSPLCVGTAAVLLAKEWTRETSKQCGFFEETYVRQCLEFVQQHLCFCGRRTSSPQTECTCAGICNSTVEDVYRAAVVLLRTYDS
eukprot:PhM_4_TR2844/c0_g1_i1/m.36977